MDSPKKPDILSLALNRLEKYLNVDIRYVASGGFWLATAQAIASVSGFLITLAFANWFPKESYGTYRYLLSAAGLLSALSLSGLNTAIIQSVARGYEKIFRRAWIRNWRWSVGFVLASLGVAGYYFWQQNSILALGMVITAVGAPLLNSWLLFKSFLNGKQKFRSLAWSSLWVSTIPALAIILSVWVSNNILVVLAVYYLSNIIVASLMYWQTLRTYRPNNLEDPSSHRFSRHLSLINILDVIATYIDKVLAFQLLGGTVLAVYSLATAIPEHLRTLLKNIATMAIPRYSNRTLPVIANTISKKILLMLAITVPCVIIYVAFAPLIFSILFPQYLDSIVYSRLFAVILLFEGGLAGAALKATMAIKEQYVLNIGTNITKIGLLVLGAFYFGLWGIIVARILTRALSFGLSWWLVIKTRSALSTTN